MEVKEESISKHILGGGWGSELGIFVSPRACMDVPAYMGGGNLRFLSSSSAYMVVPDSIYRHISSYSFILFLTYFFIFSTYSFIFLHISSYYLHVYYIKEFPNVTSSRVGGVLTNPEITPYAQSWKCLRVLWTFSRM